MIGKMTRIKTHFDMFLRILREESEGDLMYYLQSIDTPQEAFDVIKRLDDRLIDLSNKEFDREMSRETYTTKDELIRRFIYITEQQRGYPLWMWELGDVEDWASSRAEDNGYKHLFDYED